MEKCIFVPHEKKTICCCLQEKKIFWLRKVQKKKVTSTMKIPATIEIITWFTAGHYRHGVRFIENRHEIDEKVVESSQIGDACRLKHYRWVNKYAMSRQRQLKHTPWHRQSSVNNCLHVGAKNAFHNFPYLLGTGSFRPESRSPSESFRPYSRSPRFPFAPGRFALIY